LRLSMEVCPSLFLLNPIFIKNKNGIGGYTRFGLMHVVHSSVGLHYIMCGKQILIILKIEHFVALIVAFLGITGYLPYAALVGKIWKKGDS
jgi:hypothetical protein